MTVGWMREVVAGLWWLRNPIRWERKSSWSAWHWNTQIFRSQMRNHCHIQGRIQEFAYRGPVPIVPSFPLLLPLSVSFPLQVGLLKPATASEDRWKLLKGVRTPGWKRTWCTLKLSESHWWQSFWSFWVYLFYVFEEIKMATVSP